MKFCRQIMPYALVTATMISCGSDDSNKSVNESDTPSVLLSDEVSFPDPATVFSLVSGDCRKDEVGGSVHSALVLSPGNGGRFVTEIFENEICSSPPSVTTVKKLSYTEGQAIGNSKELDLIEQITLMNVQTKALVDQYNENEYCQIQSYAVREWVDISSCSDKKLKLYTVVEVGSDTLILGGSGSSSEDGSSVNKRRTSIDNGSEFGKVDSLAKSFE